MSVRRKQKGVPVPDVVVANAGEVMLMWEVGRLRQLHLDCFKKFDEAGFNPYHHGRKGREVVKRLLQTLRTECSRHLEMFAHHADVYREHVDDQLPCDLDTVSEILGKVVLDADAISSGDIGEKDKLVLGFAAVAGLRKAEISVSVVDWALSVVEQAPSKRYRDTKCQLEMLLADRVAQRIRIAKRVKASLVQRGVAHCESHLRMRAVCAMRHNFPCALWSPTIHET